MARDYKIIQKSPQPGVDGDWVVSGAAEIDGASTLTGAVTAGSTMSVAEAITATGGIIGAPTAIAANGTLAGAGPYVFNGANAAIHMPLVASFDGVTIIVANQNGTGTATITDDATDSAALVGNGASETSFLLTPYEVVHLTAYAAGTCWFVTN